MPGFRAALSYAASAFRLRDDHPLGLAAHDKPAALGRRFEG
jgi:hypothetical protein